MKFNIVLILLNLFFWIGCENDKKNRNPKGRKDLTESDAKIIKQTQLDDLPFLIYLGKSDSVTFSVPQPEIESSDYFERLCREKNANKTIIRHWDIRTTENSRVYQYNNLGLLDSVSISTDEYHEFSFRYFKRGDTILRIERKRTAKKKRDTTTQLSGRKIFVLKNDTLTKSLAFKDRKLVEECFFYYQFGNLTDKVSIKHSRYRNTLFKDYKFRNRDHFYYLSKVVTSHYVYSNEQINRIEKYIPGNIIVVKFKNNNIEKMLSYSMIDTLVLKSIVQKET